MANKEAATSTANREIIGTRIINAPRELVFMVWTDPVHIAKWWGPNGFTNTIYKMEVKPKGEWDFIMHGPDGTNYRNQNLFTEVVRPERLVYEHVSAPHHHVEVTFEDLGDKTKLTMHMVFDTAEEFERVVKAFNAVEGQKQTLNHLEEYLKNLYTEHQFSFTRIINAPRELVYKAFSNADSLGKWWGPKGFAMLVTKLDFKPGGLFHYSMKSPEGHEMWGRFVYHEIVEPEKIIFVNSFSDKDGEIIRAPFSPNWPLEILNVLTLTELKGKTTLTLKGGPINANAEEMKTFVNWYSSMQQGFGGTFDQLEEYLAKNS